MVQKSGKLTSWGEGSLSHYLQGFSTIPGGCLGFQPSTVAPKTGWLEYDPFPLKMAYFRLAFAVRFGERFWPKKTQKTFSGRT